MVLPITNWEYEDQARNPIFSTVTESSTSQHQSWLTPFHHINFSIPTVQSSHLQPQQCFQNMNLMFSLSHRLLKILSGLPLALRIETKILNDVWYSPSPPLQPHLNHIALCILPHWLPYSFMVHALLLPWRLFHPFPLVPFQIASSQPSEFSSDVPSSRENLPEGLGKLPISQF